MFGKADAYRCGDSTLDAQTAQIVEHIGRMRALATSAAAPSVLRRKLLVLISFTLKHALDEEDAIERAKGPVAEYRDRHDRLAVIVSQEMLRFVKGDPDAAFAIANAVELHLIEERPALREALRR